MRQNLLFAIGLAAVAAAAVASPRFDNFRATSFSGRTGKVHLVDAKSFQYATILRDAARRKPNFAGHYVLASWGCGASCTMSAAIDAKTGDVAWLPFTVCCWEPNISEPLEFRQNSRLLIVHGGRNEQGSGVHYYDFDGRRFLEVPES
jgi:hypothetical protein